MKSFIQVEEAQQLILDAMYPVSTQRVPLLSALGRVLAQDCYSKWDAPAFDNSARDGFAVRWADMSAPFVAPVIETIMAGHMPQRVVGHGEVAKIMTGAPMPEGADTVVMREQCIEHDDHIEIVTLPDVQGQWVRKAGSYVRADQCLIKKGATIGGGDIGTLASFGHTWLTVYRRPRVAIIGTGDELVELGQPTLEGQIINSNTPMLAALATQFGAEVDMFPIISDTYQALKDAYTQATMQYDLVISSGGASVGDGDHVHDVLTQLTDDVQFWRIRMKPGKPLVFGCAKDTQTPMIGLPGNPVSSFVCFHQFVRPALSKLSGKQGRHTLKQISATLRGHVQSTPKRRQYMTGTLKYNTTGPTFIPLQEQESGNVSLMSQVDAMGIVEEGVSTMDGGDQIRVDLLNE